jgi:hypothetical protein
MTGLVARLLAGFASLHRAMQWQEEISPSLRVVDIPTFEDAFLAHRSPCVRVKPRPLQSAESINNLARTESATNIYGLYADGNDLEENGDDSTSDEDQIPDSGIDATSQSRQNGDADYDEPSSMNAAVRDRVNRTFASNNGEKKERKDSIRLSGIQRTRSMGSNSAMQGHRSSVSSAVVAERQSGGRISIPSLAEVCAVPSSNARIVLGTRSSRLHLSCVHLPMLTFISFLGLHLNSRSFWSERGSL